MTREDRFDKEATERPKDFRVEGRKPAKRVRKRKDILADRHVGEHAVHEMRGGIGHTSARAARAEPAPFARKCDEQIVATRIAARANEAVREDTALQVFSKFALDIFRNWLRIHIAGVDEEALEVLTHDAVEDGLSEPAWRVRGGEPGHAPWHGDT